MRRKIFLSFLTLCFSIISLATMAQENTSDILSETEYLQLVVKNHPLAKKAENLRSFGEYSVLAAKGGFDPYLSSKNKQKYYDGKNYYLLSNSGINLPTRLGLSLQAGYDWNEGEFINEQNTLPANGLWYAGVSVPLLQGLLIDEERTALRKAFLDERYYQNQSQILMNNLLLEASNHYWTWVQMSYKKEVLEEAYDYKMAFRQGDKPAIDTLEAMIQLQNFDVQRKQIMNDLRSAELSLLTFLWQDNVEAMDSIGSSPVSIINNDLPLVDSLQIYLGDFISDHPELQNYDLKVQKASIDNRMKREKLKPKLNLEYNLLQNPTNNFSEIRGLDNYNWGVSFSMPLFLRKERGELKMSNIKLENTNFEYQQKKQSIANKARQYEYAFQNVKEQLKTYSEVTAQYETLLKAELRKFDIGESSIFLINYRQLALVNAELKLIELQTKYRMYYRQWIHSLGAPSDIWLAQ